MSDEYEVRAAEHATPEPKVTPEMVKTLRQLAKWERIDGCVNEATTIEAVLAERERSRQDFERWNHRIRDLTNYSDKLKADVERLRKACRAVDAYEWPVDGHFDDCWWCDSKDAKRDSANGHTADCPAVLVPAALAATKQTNDTPARPEPAADRLGWFAWRDTVGMAIQTDEARASIKVTAGTEKEALALRAECSRLLAPLVRAIEPSANDTKGKR